jgi:hypothetical protein
VQSNPDLPRLTPQDEGIIAAIKLANEKLGEVGNPPQGRIDRHGRPQAQQDSLAGPHGDVGRHTNGSHHNEYNGCCTGISVLTAGTPTESHPRRAGEDHDATQLPSLINIAQRSDRSSEPR